MSIYSRYKYGRVMHEHFRSRARSHYRGSLWVRGWILFAVFLILGLAATHTLSEQTISATSKLPAIADFIDIASTAGLSASNVFGGKESSTYILESTGTGAAIFDYDNDGWPDIFLVNGTRLDGFDAKSAPTSHLYRNNHDGTFTDVTEKAGLVASGWGQGVCVGDYDNDGWDDLYVTYYGKNRLYHNRHGTFEEVADTAGVAGDGKSWGSGCAFVDYDRDGQLDLVVANYANFDIAHASPPGKYPSCLWKGIAVFCGPRGLPGGRNILYRNLGKGRFQDVTLSAHIDRTMGHYCFSVSPFDFDNDGWPDIYMSCDSAPSILYHNNRDGTFTDAGILSGVAYNVDGREQAGMGSTVADYDGDGNLDIIRTNFSDDTPTLYRNNGDGTFTDVTEQAGLGSNTQLLGWGAAFVDVDNDGWPDIFMANGHVYPEVDGKGFRTSFRERKALFLNQRNGRFKDISQNSGPGISAQFNSHGVATADFDNDGTVEILVNNSHDPPSLLKNLGEHQNWLIVKLIGTKSNHDAIGARVTVQAKGHRQVQEVRSGGGYDSQSDFRLHFGVDAAAKVERIAIRWPSGLNEKLENVSANQILTVKEGVQTSRP